MRRGHAMLNHNQQRALAIALRLLEERLAEIENLMDRPGEGVMYRRPAAPLDANRRAAARRLMDEMRVQVEALADAFHLSREEQDPIGRIAALLNITWENLGEINARRLRAYGSVDPRLHETLDPATDRLARLALELQEIVAQPGSAIEGG